MSVLWVLVVLVVGGVVGGQWRPVYTGVIESTVALVPAASLHHEVSAHRPLGHVCQRGNTQQRHNHRTRTNLPTTTGSYVLMCIKLYFTYLNFISIAKPLNTLLLHNS